MFSVIVGNIGTVYSATNEADARLYFDIYKQRSLENFGRGAGESVTLMQDDEPIEEYIGTLNQND